MTDTLRICEIFHSIQGESSFSGQPCVFVRMSGCNLRCRWCDTTYAYQDGSPWTLDDILSRVAEGGVAQIVAQGDGLRQILV